MMRSAKRALVLLAWLLPCLGGLLVALILLGRGSTGLAEPTGQGSTGPPAPSVQRTSLLEEDPPRRSEAGQPERRPGAIRPSGTFSLIFLMRDTRAPARGTRWRIQGANSSAEKMVSVPADGLVALETGTWEVTPLSKGVAHDGTDVVTGPGQTPVVWVRRITTATVVVTAAGGRPIPDAVVRWKPDSPWLHDQPWSAEAHTDSGGAASLAGIPGSDVVLAIQAAKFVSRTLQIATMPKRLSVVLPPMGDPLTLHVVRADTKEPIVAPISVEGPAGPISSRSLGNGRYALDSAVDAVTAFAPRIRVTADKFCETRVKLPEEAGSSPPDASTSGEHDILVPLLAAAPMTVSIHAGQQEGMLGYEIDELPWSLGDQCYISMSASHPFRGEANWSVTVPDGSKVIFVGRTDAGMSATREVVATSGRRIDLVPESTAHLQIALLDAEGQRLQRAVARVRWRLRNRPQPEFRVEESEDGNLDVPMADLATEISIRAPSSERVVLFPILDSTAPRSGSVTLRMSKRVPVRFRVRDGAGHPVPGAELTLVNMDFDAVRRYPNLFGSYPTDHPAWMCQRTAMQTITTDGKGEVTAHVAPGRWNAAARLSGTVPPYSVLAPQKQTATKMLVTGPSSKDIVIPETRLLSVETRDARTDDPIAKAQIVLGGDKVGSESYQVREARAELLVPTDATTMTVSSEGYHSRTVGISDDRVYAILLEPIDTRSLGTLELVGAARAGLVGKQIQIVARDVAGSEGTPLWTGRLTVENPARIPLDIPLDRPAVVDVSDDRDVQEAGPGGYLFLPIRQDWYRGATLVFEVRERDKQE